MFNQLSSVSIVELQKNHAEVLHRLTQSPVLLTADEESAILVSVEQWQADQDELRRLRLLLEALQIKEKNEPTVSFAEVKRRIAEKRASADVAN